jgi:hypothetical protein
LRQRYHKLRNCFGHTRWYSILTRLKWKLKLVFLEIVLILMQDMCTVCAECTIGTKSSWTYPMLLLGDEAQVDGHFGPFGDCANLDTR